MAMALDTLEDEVLFSGTKMDLVELQQLLKALAESQRQGEDREASSQNQCSSSKSDSDVKHSPQEPVGKVIDEKLITDFAKLDKNQFWGLFDDDLDKLQVEDERIVEYRGTVQEDPVTDLSPLYPEETALCHLAEIIGKQVYTLKTFNTTVQLYSSEKKYYRDIMNYISNSQEQSRLMKVRVHRIYKIKRYGHVDVNFKVCERNPESGTRMMLFHGTTQEKVFGILQTGFVRPESRGQMFGNGIYFADRWVKSSAYCRSFSGSGKCLMLLCDVQLGKKIFAAKSAHNNLTEPPERFTSVKGLGTNVPDVLGRIDYHGSIMPTGKTISAPNNAGRSLIHNEYIVYHPDLINLKFLIEYEDI